MYPTVNYIVIFYVQRLDFGDFEGGVVLGLDLTMIRMTVLIGKILTYS